MCMLLSRGKEVVTTAKIRFDVEDTGIGIEPEKLDTVFESFTQADNSTSRKYGGDRPGFDDNKEDCRFALRYRYGQKHTGAWKRFYIDSAVG